jgi:hypothetical protein
VVIAPVAAKVPVAGSYNSALAKTEAPGFKEELPPVIKTLPLGRRVAVCDDLPMVIAPVAAKVPVAGSYNSALERGESELALPPAIKTLPFVSKVAVCPLRSVIILPVEVNVPGDCAMAVGTAPSVRSGRKSPIFMPQLR